MKAFNINNYVKIRLNPSAIEILNKKGVGIPKQDKDGYCQMQMWMVMNIFGEYMTACCIDSPFKQEILIDDKYLDTK